MILKGIGFVLLGIGLFLLAAYVVMRLWNWLVPALFNGPKLQFVQAIGLFFLTRFLFGFGWGGFHGFGHGGYGPRGHGYGRELHWQKHHHADQKSDKKNTSQHQDSVYYHTQYKL